MRLIFDFNESEDLNHIGSKASSAHAWALLPTCAV
jgi:hypothetical protein